MKLVYPAIFSPCENKEGFTVTVPDLPGCVTEGANLAEALAMAVDAASGWVLDELEDGKTPPAASEYLDVPKGDFISMLLLDMDAYAEKFGQKAVRKNLTIPAYLNTFAEKHNVNFSKVLQDALTAMYSMF